MPPPPFTAVSLFTGAGGLDIGLAQTGFQTVTAVDSDADCVATLMTNRAQGDEAYLHHARVVHAGVESLQPSDLRPADARRDWVPDVLAGGPPCQPFSSSGKMLSVNDPRGRLFEHFVRLAEGLRPKLILFENVRGLVTARGPNGEPGGAIELVKLAFERIGYATTFALLNAADYGTPQRRVRCFMMATNGTALPVFPEPTHGERRAPDLFGGAPWVSLGEFLGSQPPPDGAEIVRPTAQLEALLRDVPAGSGLKSAGARETTRPGGHWGYRQGTFVADLDQPARTVTASASQDWVRTTGGLLRRLTLRECAALQGFPAWWRFEGPVASRFRQVGNAVPVVFGRALGLSLIEALRGGKQERPRSARFPPQFEAAIRYTQREHARNGESRRTAKLRMAQPGADLDSVKGVGSAAPSPRWRAG